MNLNERLAWAAGFIDGEGYVGLSRGSDTISKRPFFQALVDVAQKHPEPLVELVNLFGGKVREGKNRCGVVFYWRVSGAGASRVLLAISPYLIVKQRQAELLIKYCETLCGRQGRRVTPEVFALRESMHLELRALNKRRSPGHAERLSEEAPQATVGGAIVRSHGNSNRETGAEMTPALRIAK